MSAIALRLAKSTLALEGLPEQDATRPNSARRLSAAQVRYNVACGSKPVSLDTLDCPLGRPAPRACMTRENSLTTGIGSKETEAMNARHLPLLVLSAVLFQACPAEMWIPIETMPRAAVTTEHVVFLDEVPTK